MSTTLAALRIGLLKQAKDYCSGTVTTGSSATVFIDTKLADRRVYPKVGQYVIFTSGDNAGEARKISAFDTATFQVTVNRAFSKTPSATNAYIISSFNFDDITDALNEARLVAYPFLYNLVDDYKSVFRANVERYAVPTGMKDLRQILTAPASYIETNIVSNPNFEDWTDGEPDDWSYTAASETPVQVTDASFITQGSSAVMVQGKYVDDEWPSFYIAGGLTEDIENYWGMTLKLRAHVYATVADIFSVALTDDDVQTSSAYHQGTGWEWLEVEQVVSPGTTTLGWAIICDGEDEYLFYADEVSCIVESLEQGHDYSPVYNWKQWGDVVEVKGTTDFQIRFIGMGYLSEVSADTDTMEIDDPQTELLYEYALYHLYKGMIRQMPDQTSPYYETQMSLCEHNISRLQKAVGMAKPSYVNGVPDYE